MPDLEFLDVHVTLGRPALRKYAAAEDPVLAKRELATLSITRGLVRHALAAEYNAAVGNRALCDALAGIDGFQPVWTVMPHWTGEFPSPAETLAHMAAAGARCAVTYPLQHGYPLRETVAGPLLGALADARVPLFLPHSEASIESAENIAFRHPALPVILSNVSYTLAREIYASFARCPNLYVEISGLMLHGAIEDICARFGEGRLLFGSRYPLYNPGCAVSAVIYADIKDCDRRAIACGNADRLLKEVAL